MIRDIANPAWMDRDSAKENKVDQSSSSSVMLRTYTTNWRRARKRTCKLFRLIINKVAVVVCNKLLLTFLGPHPTDLPIWCHQTMAGRGTPSVGRTKVCYRTPESIHTGMKLRREYWCVLTCGRDRNSEGLPGMPQLTTVTHSWCMVMQQMPQMVSFWKAQAVYFTNRR